MAGGSAAKTLAPDIGSIHSGGFVLALRYSRQPPKREMSTAVDGSSDATQKIPEHFHVVFQFDDAKPQPRRLVGQQPLEVLEVELVDLAGDGHSLTLHRSHSRVNVAYRENLVPRGGPSVRHEPRALEIGVEDVAAHECPVDEELDR